MGEERLNSNSTFNHFLNLLKNLKENDNQLSLGDVRYLKSLAEEFSNKKESNKALFLLKKEVNNFGTKEARDFFSSNPKLNLLNILSKKNEEVPDFLKELISQKKDHLGKAFIDLNEFKKLNTKQKNIILELAKTSMNYYREKIQKSRSGFTKEKEIIENILNFINEANIK